jgi:polyferredoxin
MNDIEKEQRKKEAEKWERLYIPRIAFIVITFIITIICIFYTIYYQFTNPQLTMTQITIYSIKRFWWDIILFYRAIYVLNKLLN